MSTGDATPTSTKTNPADTPAPPALYTVNRSQDGAQVRTQLSLTDAQSECTMLNAQARMQVGLTAATYDARGGMVRAAQPIYGSMFHGQMTRYEVRSADGLVVSS